METKVLDHGYVRLVETWGSDESIIEAARMSTGKGFNGWGDATCANCGEPWETTGALLSPPRCAIGRGGGHTIAGLRGDERLLRFLWENKHATPFEMAGAIFEVKAPIFVFREWHRHRTQSYNEMSARYTPLPDENYIPTVERLMIGSDGKNKQAGTVTGATALDVEHAEKFRTALRIVYDGQQSLYEDALSWGVPKELARIHLPVGRYSRMRASAVLRNWLAFASLRSTAKNPAAQWEIRQYADALCALLGERFPRTMALFAEGSR